MSEAALILFVILNGAVALGAVYLVSEAYSSAAEAEARRVADWWFRSQSHIDNLQDRVMTKEFETYAQASYVEKPSDQPQFTAEGEYNAGSMAKDLLKSLRRHQDVDPYADVVDDLPEDYQPLVG